LHSSTPFLPAPSHARYSIGSAFFACTFDAPVTASYLCYITLQRPAYPLVQPIPADCGAIQDPSRTHPGQIADYPVPASPKHLHHYWEAICSKSILESNGFLELCPLPRSNTTITLRNETSPATTFTGFRIPYVSTTMDSEDGQVFVKVGT